MCVVFGLAEAAADAEYVGDRDALELAEDVSEGDAVALTLPDGDVDCNDVAELGGLREPVPLPLNVIIGEAVAQADVVRDPVDVAEALRERDDVLQLDNEGVALGEGE